MNHCFIRSFSASQCFYQVINQECPDAVDGKQINREEDDRYQSDQRRVPYHHERRPRNAAHLATGVAEKLGRPLKETRARAGKSTLASRPSSFSALAKCGCARAWRTDRFFDGRVACRRRLGHPLFVLVIVPCRHLLSSPLKLLYRFLAGVPGFEPGLSVLET